MRLRPYGPSAWIAEQLDDPPAWASGVRAAVAAGALPPVVDVVPAETSVVVTCARAETASVGRELERVEPRPVARTAEAVVIDVAYDGPDLRSVATATGYSVDEVIAFHTATEHRVAFCGFSPGFAYLDGLDPRLHLARRSSPRPMVPAGSVAIAAHYSAVYPGTTPGGWHLIGRTDTRVWDVGREPPALLTPGTRIRFRRTA